MGFSPKRQFRSRRKRRGSIKFQNVFVRVHGSSTLSFAVHITFPLQRQTRSVGIHNKFESEKMCA